MGRKTEVELANELKGRNPSAMSELHDRYGRLIYAMILRIVRDSGTAEDLTQETFMRAWNGVQFFDAQKGNIGPWLLAIARHRAIDYLRSIHFRETHTVTFEEADLAPLAATAMAFEDARRVRSAMGKLVPQHLRVIELAYFEGLSQAEVAERLGQPLGTVKSWARMALKTLRQELVPESYFACGAGIAGGQVSS